LANESIATREIPRHEVAEMSVHHGSAVGAEQASYDRRLNLPTAVMNRVHHFSFVYGRRFRMQAESVAFGKNGCPTF
jgi:hypothetical protein